MAHRVSVPTFQEIIQMIISRYRSLSAQAALAVEVTTGALSPSRRAGTRPALWLRASTALCGALVGVVLLEAPASAEIAKITVDTASDIGPFRGIAYREIKATMDGTAPGGAYSVPVTLAFPKDGAAHNGFAVVDVINTVTIGQETWPGGGGLFPWPGSISVRTTSSATATAMWA
jgi:hypothetical protein